MCRWGCVYNDTTFMCKFCGTRFCNDCLKGEFTGLMREAGCCRKCNQYKCVGKRVEYVPGKGPSEETKEKYAAWKEKQGKGKKKGKKKGGKKGKKKGGKKKKKRK
ncbi:uncharacterized protein LOC120342739 [Styela clava]|uniref:uncharacterized protein LOC120342739 n=1 Tax=Styela clava TaxID=7725 RepID=UPI00193A77C3|nr:uncharacterized protein LOC120342739 [Styela clava]